MKQLRHARFLVLMWLSILLCGIVSGITEASSDADGGSDAATIPLDGLPTSNTPRDESQGLTVTQSRIAAEHGLEIMIKDVITGPNGVVTKLIGNCFLAAFLL